MLLSVVFFSIFFVYNFYFKIKDNVKVDQSDIVQNNQSDIVQNNQSDIVQNKSSDNISNEESNFNVDDKNNLIKNLRYFSKDNLGNEYVIESKYSELNLDNVDIINMKKVSAKIIMVNSKPIYITSDFAKYNNASYETTFTDNVVIVYLNNKIKCEKFFISIKDNFANVTDNVIYENPNGILIADTIEIDLITKNSKIFMTNKNKKVMILNK